MRQSHTVKSIVRSHFGCKPSWAHAGVTPEFRYDPNKKIYYLPITYSASYNTVFKETFDGLSPKFTLFDKSNGRNGAYFGTVQLLPYDYFVWDLTHGDLLDVSKRDD